MTVLFYVHLCIEENLGPGKSFSADVSKGATVRSNRGPLSFLLKVTV